MMRLVQRHGLTLLAALVAMLVLAPLRRAIFICTRVVAKMHRNRMNATAAPDPRFHHLNPSSNMK